MLYPTPPTRPAKPLAPICHLDCDSESASLANTKLLISIRNVQEAAVVRDAGVDWIDLKDPHAGPLGRSELSEARAVAELLRDHPQRSAALGELYDLEHQVAFEFAPLFPILKVGLSRLGSGDHAVAAWKDRFELLAVKLRERGAELIPVAYADWSICAAPSLQDVLRVAKHIAASHLLIDTYFKDGRSLLDWLSREDLQRVIQSAREFNCGVVVAGSLKITEVPQLLKLQPAALAVRGAVCQSDASNQLVSPTQSRTAPIDSRKVEMWRALVH